MNSTGTDFPYGKTASVIPVLSAVIPDSQMSNALRAALAARDLEQTSFMALGDEVLRSLRPELERLTTELVQRSLRQAWANRYKLDEQ